MRLRLSSILRSFRGATAFRVAALAVVLVAFLIRVYRLDAVGLEGDEAFALKVAYSGFANVLSIASTVEPHPPLYYAFLRVWYLLAGTSEFALRYPSLVANVLTVAFLFKLADLFSWRSAGMIGALLLALSPYQIWYAQEARMYAPVELLGLVAIYFALRCLRGETWSHLGLYAVFMLLSLYTHYYAIFLLLFVNLLWLGTTLHHPSRRLVSRWLVTQGVVVALYLPWLVYAQGIAVSFQRWARGTVDLLAILKESLSTYAVGVSLPSDTAFALSLGFLAVAAVGLWFSGRLGGQYPPRQRYAFVAGYLLLPVTVGLFVSLVRPMFAVRYLMVSAPAFYLVLALGVTGLFRKSWPLGIIAGLFLLAVPAYSLNNYFSDDKYAKTDFPSAVDYIVKHSRPGDGIVLDGYSQTFQFWYYYTLKAKQPLPTYVIVTPAPGFQDVLPLRFNEPVPTSLVRLDGPDAAQRMPQELDDIMAKQQGIWFMDYDSLVQDPAHQVETYLARNYYQALYQRVRWNRVAYYASAPAASQISPLDVTFDDEVMLKDVGVDTASVGPGEILHLTLHWQGLKKTAKEYTVSWRLQDAQGHIVYQRDAGPASDLSPSTAWTPGQEVADRYGLPVPVWLPPGQYALAIVVYDKLSGQALRPLQGGVALSGDRVPLVRVVVLDTAPVAALQGASASHAAQLSLGGLTLLGFDPPAGTYRPGDTVTVRLLWQATEDIRQSYAAVVRLLNDNGTAMQERTLELGPSTFAGGVWPRGRILATYVDVPVPARALSGPHRLSLVLKSPGPGETSFSDFPAVSVVARQRSFDVPSVSRARAANFGGLIELLGYDQQPAPTQALAPGQELRLTLYWRAGREMAENYKLFIHLVGPDGQIHGQRDAMPLDGKAPTSGWVAGEVLTDPHAIVLPPDAPAGTYQVVAGFYDAETGARIPLSDGSGDSLVLTTLDVAGDRR